MKKAIYIFLLAACALSGCKKDAFLDWKAMNKQWLDLNRNRTLVIENRAYKVEELASGLQYVVVSDPTPTDAKPSMSSTVICDYQLCLINQVQLIPDNEGRDTLRFSESMYIDKRTWSSMPVSSVISGFAEGIEKVHNNGDIVLFIPYEIGYGPDGQNNGQGAEGGSGFIPPYSTLIFKIHVCGVN